MSGSKATSSIFARNATGLVKQISGLDALGMVVTQMGLLYVFNVVAFTPGFYPSANPLAGPLIGILLVLPVVGVYIIFSIAMPRSGGDYVWTSRTFNPAIGFTTNFALTLIVISVVAAVAPWIGDWSIAQMFYDLGYLQHNASYTALANSLLDPTTTFIVSAVFVIIAGLVVMASSKLAARVVKYWAFISIAIGIVFIATVLFAGASTFASNYNTYAASIHSNMTYDQVISTGQSQFGAYNGVPPLFSYATLYAGALGLLGYLGFNSSAYFAGEVRQNKRNQIIAQLGGTILYAAFVTIMIAVEYFGEGPKFVNAIAGMWTGAAYGGYTNYPYLGTTPPLASGLSMFWTSNPILIAMFTLSFGITAFVMDISIFFTFTRNLFAWSFDRVAPTAFATINPRTRTPIYAAAIITAVGIVYTYIASYTSFVADLFSYGTAGEFIVFAIVSIAAIIFPYRRRDLFDSSADSAAKKKIGGVPLLTILGAISLAVCLVTIYAIILPEIGGVSFWTIFFEGIIPTFIIGAVLYAVIWAIRKRQGINLGMLQKEIPPE
ncbi:MAG TPA: APC family permease [Nitrososphaerales archaeon]|nr:APC family permease [Nitrososphaerales archaeon]